MTLWLQDLVAGAEYTTSSRRLTETDLVAFSMLSGDWNPIHTDPDHARAAGYDEPVLHGVLGIAVVTGQIDRAGWFDRSAVAMLGIADWRFVRPLTVGGVVHTEMTITGVRPSASRPSVGVVGRELRLVDSSGAVLQTGSIAMLVAAQEPQAP